MTLQLTSEESISRHVSVQMDILNTVYEQTLANNLHFSCVFAQVTSIYRVSFLLW